MSDFYNLPELWRLVTIGSVCNQIQLVDAHNKSSESFQYIDISSIDNHQKKITNVTKVVFNEAPSRARQVIETSDVLVSTTRPSLNAVALVPEYLNGEICSTGFSVLRPKPDLIESEYLFAWVRHPVFIENLVRLQRGLSYPAVSDRDVKGISFPLPPLPEQRRIVSILREADELNRLGREVEEILPNLLPSLFRDQFGHPSNWQQTVSLGKMVQFVGGGTPARRIEKYFSGEIPWATSKDIKSRYLDDAQEHITKEAIRNSATNLVPTGTVLIVVKSKILAHSLPMAIATRSFCFGQDLKGLICNEGISPEFIVAALAVQAKSIINRARGVNTEGLTLEILRQIRIPDVGPTQQQTFLDRVDILKLTEETRQNVNRKTIELFQSLLAQAFTGKLTADWRGQHEAELSEAAQQRDALLSTSGFQLAATLASTSTLTAELTITRPVPAERQQMFAALSPKQQRVFDLANSMEGYFTLLQLSQARNEESELSHADIRQGLQLLASLGLVMSVRVATEPIKNELIFTPAYRRLLPLEDDARLRDSEQLGASYE